MYVCICNAITEKQVRHAKASGLDNLYDLQESLGVATCCGSCADVVESILNEGTSVAARPAPRLYIPSSA